MQIQLLLLLYTKDQNKYFFLYVYSMKARSNLINISSVFVTSLIQIKFSQQKDNEECFLEFPTSSLV